MDRGVDILNLCFYKADCLDIIVSLFSVLSPPVIMWDDASQFSLSILKL